MIGKLPKMWSDPVGRSPERLPVAGFTVADGSNGTSSVVAVLLKMSDGEQKTAITLYEPGDVDVFIQMLLRHKRIAWPDAP